MPLLLLGTLLFLCWKGSLREGDGDELVLMSDATLSELSSLLELRSMLMASASDDPVSVEMGLVLLEPAMLMSLLASEETLANDPWLWLLPSPRRSPSRVYRCSDACRCCCEPPSGGGWGTTGGGGGGRWC